MPVTIDLVKPVFSAQPRAGGAVEIANIAGTAFPLGRDLLLTADHVVANVLADGDEFVIGWGRAGDSFAPLSTVPLSPASVAVRWSDLESRRIATSGGLRQGAGVVRRTALDTDTRCGVPLRV